MPEKPLIPWSGTMRWSSSRIEPQWWVPTTTYDLEVTAKEGARDIGGFYLTADKGGGFLYLYLSEARKMVDERYGFSGDLIFSGGDVCYVSLGLVSPPSKARLGLAWPADDGSEPVLRNVGAGRGPVSPMLRFRLRWGNWQLRIEEPVALPGVTTRGDKVEFDWFVRTSKKIGQPGPPGEDHTWTNLPAEHEK